MYCMWHYNNIVNDIFVGFLSLIYKGSVITFAAFVTLKVITLDVMSL